MKKSSPQSEYFDSLQEETGLDITELSKVTGYRREYLWAIRRGAVPFSPQIRGVLDAIRKRGVHASAKIVTPGSERQSDLQSFAERMATWRGRCGLDVASASKVLGVGTTKLKEIEAGRAPSASLVSKFEAVEHEGARVAEEALGDRYARIRDEQQVANGISNRPAGDGRGMKIRRVPVIGWAKAGEAMDFEDVVDWETPVSVETNDEKAFAIRVKGDSMSPRICEGDLVVVSPSEPPRNEKPVVVRLRVQGILLKQFHRLSEDRFELRSLNPFYSPISAATSEVVWIYPVVAIINYP